ncbi:Hypothetical predicted protein [Mytilus galloprovincialis]|uniref:Uncharacterized protein n=1 Tax=Mytilus galloprovincialis TaxID=29158 RepID=A0A8B6HTP7_MYTGA|nr:Hypothetical predicted protein [Mytilus galloprovincialis]
MVDNNIVCMLSQSGEIKTVIDTSPMRPLSLHVNKYNEMIVGIKEQGPIFPVQKDSVRQVIIFGSDNKRKVTLETDTTGRKLFNYPARIETDSANVLYVADWMDTDLSGRVVAVDTNGYLKFAYAGHQDLQPFFPHGIAITPSNNVILSDQSNNALHVLNSTGELIGLHLLDSILHIKAPLSLCFDHEGHLLIGSGKLVNSNAKIYVTKVAKKIV